MTKRVTMLVAALLVFGCFAWSAQHVFYGTVSDSNCGAKHSRASAAATECVKKCVAGGASYVLVSKGQVYKVDPQDKFADYAGQRVRVHGTLNGDTITAESVSPVSHHHAMAPSSGGM
ncbi:MAG: DUF5818 domain-containing protein [Terriglobia bacterium]